MAAPDPNAKVEIQSQFILVHPGTTLTVQDVKALNDVLQKFDKSLYKIEVYHDGKVINPRGTLSDMKIDQKVAAELADAKKNGGSQRAIQVIAPPQAGATTNPQQGSPTPGAVTNPQNSIATPGVTTNPQTGTPTPGATTNPQFGGSTTNPQRDSSSPVNPQTNTLGSATPSATPFKPLSAGAPQMAASATNPQFAASATNPQTTGSSTNPQKDTLSTPAATDVIQQLTPILEKYSGDKQ